jgi:hypothetical protein
MKKSTYPPLTLLLILILVVSCKKEIVSEQISMPATLAVSVTPPEISRYNGSYEVTSTEYNSCTLENMYVTGAVVYSSSSRWSTDALYITYTANYNGLSATGLTTGQKYQANGQVSETLKAVIDYDAVSIVNRNIINKITYATPGIKNNMSANVISHVVFDRSGTTLINLVSHEWEKCK